MILAAILGMHLATLSYMQQPPAWSASPARVPVASKSDPTPQAQSQSQSSPPVTVPQKSQSPDASPVTKPPATHHRKRKRTVAPNCTEAPSSINAGGTTTAQTSGGSSAAGSAGTSSQQLPPCPPPKRVIRNGGSSEPSIQLSGGTSGEQASQQQSTEQLTAATNENLKKIEGRQLNASQQETVNQIKQFMDQSKAAITAGDPQRGRSLAAKAHLLSAELVKP